MCDTKGSTVFDKMLPVDDNVLAVAVLFRFVCINSTLFSNLDNADEVNSVIIQTRP